MFDKEFFNKFSDFKKTLFKRLENLIFSKSCFILMYAKRKFYPLLLFFMPLPFYKENLIFFNSIAFILFDSGNIYCSR